ncbi:UNVERIFIED_CONTAM: hypothetical protein Sradi_4537900 [Sesamum radiatum]|uniref:Uncharacterized protein n=1 Tax=Sesamum radiatum TaxID=300843 RepID=A0AAW2NCQ1_SESRA
MEHSKRGFLPMRHGVKRSKKQSPKTNEELKRMLDIPYASAKGSIQYVVQCTRPDITYALSWCGGLEEYKQDTTADSTTKVDCIVASEAAKEAVWMENDIHEFRIVPSITEPIIISCDKNGAIAQVRESRSHHQSKHILRRYYILREMVGRGDVRMDRVSSAENIVDPLKKPVSQIAHARHLGKMGLR